MIRGESFLLQQSCFFFFGGTIINRFTKAEKVFGTIFRQSASDPCVQTPLIMILIVKISLWKCLDHFPTTH
jgi:hypothetical protein